MISEKLIVIFQQNPTSSQYPLYFQLFSLVLYSFHKSFLRLCKIILAHQVSTTKQFQHLQDLKETFCHSNEQDFCWKEYPLLFSLLLHLQTPLNFKDKSLKPFDTFK